MEQVFYAVNHNSQKRNDSFQFTIHVSTYSCDLQLQMGFFLNGRTLEFILRYVTKLRVRTCVQFEYN